MKERERESRKREKGAVREGKREREIGELICELRIVRKTRKKEIERERIIGVTGEKEARLEKENFHFFFVLQIYKKIRCKKQQNKKKKLT